MKKILITTDFSANSRSAIRLGCQLSQQTRCEILFFHAVEIMKPTSWSERHYKEFEQERIKEKTTELMKFLEKLIPADISRSKISYICETGTNVNVLVQKIAKKEKADLICIGTHGAGKFQKIFGTHSSELITNSAIPVLTVPPGYRTKPVINILYASDFANISKEIKQVGEFADLLKAKVEVYHYDYLLHVPEQLNKLEKKAEQLKKKNIRFNFKRQEIELPLSEQLQQDILKVKPSMVVLFTKQNRGWFDRMFLSSESADLSFHSKFPLLTFRKQIG